MNFIPRTLRLSTAAISTSIAMLAAGHAQAEPLKIGVLLPTTGVFAAIAAEQLNGMQIALEEAGGKVGDRVIELLAVTLVVPTGCHEAAAAREHG